MEIVEDAKVVTADGKHVGKVDRVVLNPRSHEVTHVVVREGVIVKKDKLVPIDDVDTAEGGELRLKPGAPNPDNLEDFRETDYIQLTPEEQARANYDNDAIEPIYTYPLYGVNPVWGGTAYFGPYMGEYPGGVRPETETNIPEGTVPLTEGMDVISADGQTVGALKEVGVDPKTDLASHLVISEGLLLKKEKVVPTDWIDEVDDHGIHLTVGAKFVQDLPDRKD